ncbi:MAG TPA: hypothetical protein VJW76_10290 [Verrucomicrobiae bacterium]|nr:hypothetical protein [Verrucomicrobiae bacterium]
MRRTLRGAGFWWVVSLVCLLCAANAGPATSWQLSQGNPSDGLLRAIVYVNGNFVVASRGQLLRSIDGVTWTRAGAVQFDDITFGQDTYAAVGLWAGIQTSPDGVTWTQRILKAGARDRVRNAIAYGNGTFVSISGESAGLFWTHYIETSRDGIEWGDTRRAEFGQGGDDFGITFANGMFVAVGFNAIYTSTDAISSNSWTRHTYSPPVRLHDVVYADDRFLAVGSGGTILSSPDAATWTALNSSVTSELRGVAWGQGTFVAVGDGGTILTSTNGSDWVRQDSGVTVSLNDVCYANNQFVAVGENGTILQSTNVEPPTLSGKYVADGGFNLTLAGGTAPAYRIQSSADLESWADLVTVTNTQGLTHYTDTAATVLNQRFYRVLSR